jgi:hypothetical protein
LSNTKCALEEKKILRNAGTRRSGEYRMNDQSDVDEGVEARRKPIDAIAIRIAEIKGMIAAATPGNWRHVHGEVGFRVHHSRFA